LYDDLEREGKLMFSLRDPSIGWWIYGRAGSDEYNHTIHFEVF
jgi:hypothetical protein